MDNEQELAPAEQTNEPTAQVINPEALARKNVELLDEIKKLKREFAGIDPSAARQALETVEKAEEEKLAKKGEFEKLLEQRQRAYEERIAQVSSDRDQILTNLKREKLANVLAEKGVLPDRTRFLVRELEQQIELASDESGFSLRKIGGVGDSSEFDALVEKVKGEFPFFFGASLAPGSGASGSSGHGSGQVGRKWADLSRAEKTAAIRDAGGDLEAAQKNYR